MKTLLDRMSEIIAEMEMIVEEEETLMEHGNDDRLKELEAEAEDIRSKIEYQRKLQERITTYKSTLAPRSAPAAAVEERASVEVAEVKHETRGVEIAAKPFAVARRSYNLRAFKGPNAEECAYRSGMWIRGYVLRDSESRRWCEDHGVVATRASGLPAQGESDIALGGAVAPDEMADWIIKMYEEYGAYPQHSWRTPMTSDKLTIPRRLSGLQAVPVNENSSPDAATMQFDQVDLTAGMWAVVNRVSNSLMEDSVINLADLLVTEASLGFAKAFDTAGFHGDGTAAYNGTKGVCWEFEQGSHSAGVHTATASTFQKLTMEDFTAAMALCPEYALGNAAWYISPAGFASGMVPIAMAAGGVTSAEVGDGPNRANFMGFPVRRVTVMQSGVGAAGKVAALFGDFGMACTMGDRRRVEIKTSADRFMEFDQTLIYGNARVAMVAHDLGDTSEAGPLVALMFGSST